MRTVLAFMAMASMALAQVELTTSGMSGSGTGVSVLDCQGVAKPAIAGIGVACACNGCVPRYTTDNGWARRWAGFGPASVSSVEFSVEICEANTPGSGDCLVDVNLYDMAPGSFPTKPATPGMAIVADQPPTATPVDRVVPVSPAFAVAAGNDLVVEVYQYDGTADGHAMWIGATNVGAQTSPSFIMAIGCGIANWTDIATFGFPTNYWIICQDTGGGGNPCNGNEKFKAKCKNGTITVSVKNGTPNANYPYTLDGNADNVATNGAGKGKDKTKNQVVGPHRVVICGKAINVIC